jgi:hypothetical protein
LLEREEKESGRRGRREEEGEEEREKSKYSPMAICSEKYLYASFPFGNFSSFLLEVFTNLIRFSWS